MHSAQQTHPPQAPGPQPQAQQVQQVQGWAPGAQPPGHYAQPAAGPQWQQAPGHQGWAPGRQWQQGPGAPIPLTRPGWGAIPAVLGAVLGVLGLFALKWSGDVTWFELADAMRNISGDDLNGEQVLVKFYIGKGVIIAATLAAVAPIPWSFGVFRDERSIRRGGGIMKRSLLEGRTGPTRALLTGIAAAALLYHVISLLMMTDSGEHLDDLGPGPWVMVVGAALSVAGAAIGPRVPQMRR